jgi:predicted TPR repeat methyltransferase
LIGIDVAANMIEMAAARGIYDRLIKADLSAFLADNPVTFDLLIAADVFIYIGDIDVVFARARTALRPGGLLAFSVETIEEGDGYVLLPSRRYAHSPGYLRGLSSKHGFVERTILSVSVRQQEGRDLPGLIAIFERT